MKAVYVDGMRFRSVKDAALFLDGQVNGLREAIDCGLPYRGATVSHDPPLHDRKVEHFPGGTMLLRNHKVCP
jgi:hypothetical protein